jgi:hypothetical protein
VSVNRPLGATPQTGAFELTLPARTRVAVARSHAGLFALGGLVSLTVLICVAASRTFALLPATVRVTTLPSHLLPFGLGGLFGNLSLHLPAGVLMPVLALLFGCYVVVVKNAERLSPRTVLAAIAALIAIVLIAPPLMSMDVFSYEAYARMFVTYGANPYVHGPFGPLSLDPLYSYIGAHWVETPTVYGPVFTILSTFLDKLTLGVYTCLHPVPSAACQRAIAQSTFAYKGIAAVAALVTVATLWHAAKLRGLNQVRAVAVFGLNPLVIIYGVGGGHNDLLMIMFTTLGVYALLARRERATGAMIALGAAIKLTGALLLPFALAAGTGLGAERRRRSIVIGAAITSVVFALAGFGYFGIAQVNMVLTLQHIQSAGDTSSIPGFLSVVLRLDVVGHVVGLVLGLVFLAVCGWLLRRVWRGQMDWIDGAGWATVVMLVTASAMLPWYVAWLMPLVALCTSRRLWSTALWFTGAVQLITMVSYFPH